MHLVLIMRYKCDAIISHGLCVVDMAEYETKVASDCQNLRFGKDQLQHKGHLQVYNLSIVYLFYFHC